MAEVTREAILTEAIWLHDLHYGWGHCDRKYVEVCPRMQEYLFEAGKKVRERVIPPESVGGDR